MGLISFIRNWPHILEKQRQGKELQHVKRNSGRDGKEDRPIWNLVYKFRFLNLKYHISYNVFPFKIY